MFVFTNVQQEEDGQNGLLEEARELKAICFRNDIVTVNFIRHSKNTRMVFFVIGEKEGDNLIKALKLLEKYQYREKDKTELYVFSSQEEGELLLANVRQGNVIVRRVNEVRTLIYDFLCNEGKRLFDTVAAGAPAAELRAAGIPTPEKKIIYAVIAGLGRYGTEMLKALA